MDKKHHSAPESDGKKSLETTEYVDRETYEAALSQIEKLTKERDEAYRRRDAWREKAKNYDTIRDALRSKAKGNDSRSIGRAMLGAAKIEAEERAEKASGMLDVAKLNLDVIENLGSQAARLLVLLNNDLQGRVEASKLAGIESSVELVQEMTAKTRDLKETIDVP